jgi:hypothetical protein
MHIPRPIAVGDWILIVATKEAGIVEKAMDKGERLWVRVPSVTGWPFPRWVHVTAEKVKRIRPPKQETEFEEALF